MAQPFVIIVLPEIKQRLLNLQADVLFFIG